MLTPVLVGVGQVSNQDPERLVHPVDLLERAATAALADAGADLRDRIGAVYAAPLSVFSDEQGAAMVAERLGLPPGQRHQSSYSGAGPQKNVAHACREIAAGRLDAALVVGGIADASVRNARRLGVEPPAPPTSVWSQGSDGVDLERFGDWERPFSAEGSAGAQLPAAYFAVLASALAAAAGHDAIEHRHWLGRLLAPFTEVAASHPDLAWFPHARTAEAIATPSAGNRLIAEPFTKLMCSFPTVDLAAAVLVTSTELADRLGVPNDARVFPWTAASAHEHGPPSTWTQIHRSEAYALAATTACELAGIAPDEIDAFDLYSCFPAAVELGMAAFGIGHDDPRPLTLTGGLPYFGGPGASYALHGIACAVERCRSAGGLVAVGALGGFVDDFATAIFSATEPPRPFVYAGADEQLRPEPATVRVVRSADAEGRIVAGTVLHDRDRGPMAVPVIVELADGARVGARSSEPELAAHASGTTLVGQLVRVHPDGDGATWHHA